MQASDYGSGVSFGPSLLFPCREAFLFSPYGAEQGITHLALEKVWKLCFRGLPQGHQLDTSLGDKTTGSV